MSSTSTAVQESFVASNVCNPTDCSATLSQPLTPDTYTVAVQGSNATVTSDWSNVESFSVLDACAGGGCQGLIAFAADVDLDGNSKIYTMNPDGTNIQQLTLGDDQQPAWSSDRSQIAFVRWNVDNFDIFAINADGTNLRNLTNSPTHELEPSWSPDDTQIVYASDPDNDSSLDIYLMNSPYALAMIMEF